MRMLMLTLFMRHVSYVAATPLLLIDAFLFVIVIMLLLLLMALIAAAFVALFFIRLLILILHTTLSYAIAYATLILIYNFYTLFRLVSLFISLIRRHAVGDAA